MKDATIPEPPTPLPPRWVPTPDAHDIVVPGLDTTAPASEQLEQIEQLITIKLQNLDENFAAIHHLITTRLLPAIKRYAVASEPIRDAARFWISFFQASAQVRMRMDANLSTPNASNDRTVTASHTDSEVETRDEDAGQEEQEDHGQSFHTAQTDMSFQPPPTSSTPLLSRSQLGPTANPTPESSWAASMESPFSRLDRQMSSLRLDEPRPAAAQPRPPAPPSQAKSRMSLPRLKPRSPGMLKPRLKPAVEFKDTSESSGPSFSPPIHVTPMILRPPPAAGDTTASTTTTNSSAFFDRPVFHSPRGADKSKGKGKATPLRENIFRRNLLLSSAAPPQSSPRRAAPSPKKNPWSAQKQWNGIVDLREEQPPEPDYDTSDDDEEDALPAGMSPPVTLRFTRPSDVRLSRAPAPVAAQRVSQGLIAETSRARPSMGVAGALWPPVLHGTPGRLRAKKDSVEGSMVVLAGATSSESSAGPSFELPRTPGYPNAHYGALFGSEDAGADADGSDSDTEWLSAPPAPGTAMPIYDSHVNADDSDDSADFDFMGGVPVTPPVVQPMNHDFDFDDDDAGGGGEATDTIFGARHVAARPSEGPLHIHGTELLRETLDPATSEEVMPSVEQSPTPWAGRRPDYNLDVHD